MNNELINTIKSDVCNINLLNDEVKQSKEYIILTKVLKETIKINNSFFKYFRNIELITFEEFKLIIQNLIVLIMKSHLKKINHEEDKIECLIKNMGFQGIFYKKINKIVISEEIVKKIYKGNILKLEVIFHELYHFVMKYEIINNNLNLLLVRCLKDTLLCSLSPAFCFDNYDVLSFENIVDSRAIIELNSYVVDNKIKISQHDRKKMEYRLFQNIDYYYNNKRYDRNNNKYDNYENLFEFYINFNREWLRYYQIGIEYYMDNDGNIVRRNKENLQELLDKELNKENSNKILINYLSVLMNKDDRIKSKKI